MTQENKSNVQRDQKLNQQDNKLQNASGANPAINPDLQKAAKADASKKDQDRQGSQDVMKKSNPSESKIHPDEQGNQRK